MTGDLLNHIDRLMEQRPASKPALAPFRELAFLSGQSTPQVKPFPLDEGLKAVERQEGFPLFSPEDLPLDFDSASDLLKKFFEQQSGSERQDKEGLRKALEKAKTSDEWPSKLFKVLLGKDEETLSHMGKETDLEPSVLQFLGKMALRPSLHALREFVSDQIDAQGWQYGYCPLCGSSPDMAYFAKTGKRYLHCELCSQEWHFPRIRCPFCQNQDHESLGYFEAEQEEGLRVDFCRKCSRYIKTLDKRVFEEPAPLELEYLATLYLDLLARDHGFK